MAKLEEEAINRGFTHLQLSTPDMQAFYEACGYEVSIPGFTLLPNWRQVSVKEWLKGGQTLALHLDPNARFHPVEPILTLSSSKAAIYLTSNPHTCINEGDGGSCVKLEGQCRPSRCRASG